MPNSAIHIVTIHNNKRFEILEGFYNFLLDQFRTLSSTMKCSYSKHYIKNDNSEWKETNIHDKYEFIGLNENKAKFLMIQNLYELKEDTFEYDFLLDDKFSFNELIKSLKCSNWSYNWPRFKKPLRNRTY